MELLSKIVQAVMEATLPILVSALVAWLISKTCEIGKKLRDSNPELGEILTNIARAAVNAAEQSIIGTGKGKEKKEYAKNVIKKYLAAKGLTVDLDIIDAMIESQVREMNFFAPYLNADGEKSNDDIQAAIH